MTARRTCEPRSALPRFRRVTVLPPPKILSVLYTARVIGLALPYVFTFAAVLGGDLYSQWAHVMFHPIGQFMLGYALAHVTANICFNFRRGGALVRTVNGVGAVLCVAVSPLWVNLIMSGANSPDALWALIGVPLEFAACIGYYVYTARRIG